MTFLQDSSRTDNTKNFHPAYCPGDFKPSAVFSNSRLLRMAVDTPRWNLQVAILKAAGQEQLPGGYTSYARRAMVVPDSVIPSLIASVDEFLNKTISVRDLALRFDFCFFPISERVSPIDGQSNDPSDFETKREFTYFFQDIADGQIKIGYSNSPKRRQREIERRKEKDIGRTCETRMLGFIEGGRKKEEQLHQKFDSHRVRELELLGNTEWFSPAILRNSIIIVLEWLKDSVGKEDLREIVYGQLNRWINVGFDNAARLKSRFPWIINNEPSPFDVEDESLNEFIMNLSI